MAEEKQLMTRESWLREAVTRYDERQGPIRNAHFHRWGGKYSNSLRLDAFQAKLDELLKSEDFQSLKIHYLAEPPEPGNALVEYSSNRRALINMLAADCCMGSLEFMLCERDSEYPKEYLDDKK